MQGAAFGGAKYGMLNLAASDELVFTLQTVIFLYPLTLSQFWDHTPTVSAPRPHTKQYVHQETYTADLTDRSPAVKLYRRSILSSYCFTGIGNRNSMFCTIHVFLNSA